MFHAWLYNAKATWLSNLLLATAISLNNKTNLVIFFVGFIVAAMLALIFSERIPILETRFVNWFSNLTQKPRWFVFWFLVVLLWIPMRYLLMQLFNWYTSDTDLLVMTVLWSVVPYMVENVLKASSAQQTELMMQILDKINQEQVRSATRETLIIQLITKLLDIVEEPEGGQS